MGQALSRAASSIHALLSAVEPGSREIPLVACQEAIVNPPQVFEAERLG